MTHTFGCERKHGCFSGRSDAVPAPWGFLTNYDSSQAIFTNSDWDIEFVIDGENVKEAKAMDSYDDCMRFFCKMMQTLKIEDQASIMWYIKDNCFKNGVKKGKQEIQEGIKELLGISEW